MLELTKVKQVVVIVTNTTGNNDSEIVVLDCKVLIERG